MLKFLLLFLSLIALILYLKKDAPSVTKLNDVNVILAFGDSITYGYGVNKEENYPSLLSNLLKMEVINEGVNGDTSQDGLKRLPSLLNTHSVDVMLLFFGGNDVLQKKSKESIKSNLKKIIRAAKEKNIRIILISVPNLSMFGLKSLSLYQELAKEEDVELIEGILSYVLSKESLKGDYIHPNAKGHQYIAQEIYNYLQSN